MWLTVLLGCPAAQLGVELAPEGGDAISAEDLRRDTTIVLEHGSGGWVTRMAEMHAVVVPGERLCARQGDGTAQAIWVTLDGGLGTAVDAAALISLAKAWDTLADKPGPREYCIGEGPGTRFPSLGVTATAAREIDFRALASALKARP